MKQVRINAKERKQIVNATNEILLSPFKVQQAINKSRDLLLPSGLTIGQTFEKVGISKISLSDLFQADLGNGMQVCRLQKVAKRLVKDTNHLPYTYGINLFAIGNYWYVAVPAEFSVSSFLASLDDKLRLQEERQKTISLYEKLFERSEKKTVKRTKKLSKAKKAKIRLHIEKLRKMEQFEKANFVQLARFAIQLIVA